MQTAKCISILPVQFAFFIAAVMHGSQRGPDLGGGNRMLILVAAQIEQAVGVA